MSSPRDPQSVPSQPSPIPHTRAFFTPEDKEAVTSCLSSGMVASGSRVRAFESGLASRLGASDVITVTSGTAAIVLALRAVGVRHGDEVILPTYVCRAVYEAVRYVGGVPILVDNDEHRCISRKSVEPFLSPRTKAIVAVDTLGHPVTVDGLLDTGVPVIEDACQGFAGSIQGRPLGLRGTVGVISFHGTKLLPIGEGGAVLCTQASVGARIRAIREGEGDGDDEHARAGTQISDVSAALGNALLARLDATLARRAAIAALYREALASASQRVALPSADNVPYRFPLRLEGASAETYDALFARFQAQGVSIRRGVDAMNHVLFPARSSGGASFPVAERDFVETLSIPLYESLSDAEVGTVVAALQTVFSS